MNNLKKNLPFFLLAIYLFVGSIYSLKTGISHDEFHEQQNWEFNISLIKNYFFDKDLDSRFINFQDKYYGIGFHLISQPVQHLLGNIIEEHQGIDIVGSHLIAKHIMTFLFFFISGVYFVLIISKIISNRYFLFTAATLYLFYPYLLGHSFFNPKDIPFLCLWIVCSYYSIRLFEKLIIYKDISYKYTFFLAFITAFLISIRISGVLIFIQFLCTFLIFKNNEKLSIKNYQKFLIFFVFFISFVYLLYPVFWKDPLSIIVAIEYMSNYFNDVCTLTLGVCMKSKNLDSTYIPIWLLVKLPLIVLIGILLIPFVEKKIFVNKKNNLYFGTILISAFLIPVILILTKVNLYDELRQILFLVPLFFILGVISLYLFSVRLFYILSIITSFIFITENIKIYPYQYAWFNTPSRFLNLNNNFEIDYWGISGRELSNELKKISKNNQSNRCVLVSPLWTAKHFLSKKHNSDRNDFNCFGSWSDVDSNFERPFWAIQNVRNLKKSEIFKCETVYISKFKLLFSKEDLVTGKLLNCT